MSQHDVLVYLARCKNPKSSIEISKAIKVGAGSTRKAISKLLKNKEIEFSCQTRKYVSGGHLFEKTVPVYIIIK